jgi:formamidopyrimidine-DNA glycosylase
MPELVEVHRMVTYLRSRVPLGQPITNWGYNVVGYFDGHEYKDLNAFIRGATVQQISRKGKYIIFALDRGILLSHQRFTGWWEDPAAPDHLKYVEFKSPPGLQTTSVHFVLQFQGGQKLLFHDSRTLARFYPFPGVTNPTTISQLTSQGPDILALPTLDPAFVRPYDYAWFEEAYRVSSKHQAVKIWLLDQRYHAGIGNILACEALWEAKLNPFKKISDLVPAERESLYSALQKVAQDAVSNNAEYEKYIKVFYQKRCSRCGSPIQRLEQQHRGTYCCPPCQGVAMDHQYEPADFSHTEFPVDGNL